MLFHRGEYAAAEVALRELISSGLAGGRLLYVHYGSYFLVDLLLHQGELPEADAVLQAGGGAAGRQRGPAVAHPAARPPVPVCSG